MTAGAYALGVSEFLVNSKLTGIQTDSSMAALSSGGFVICWTDATSDGSGSGVRAQLYDASGVPSGSEFLVNTATLNAQDQPSVTALPGGSFVITWTDNSGTGGDSDRSSVKAQLYNSGGAAVGGEFLVNTTTRFGQSASVTTSLASGGFVISWVDASATAPDASGTGIRAQIYDSAGLKVGGEFLINTVTSGSQQASSLTGLKSGGFVATWVDSSGLGGDSTAPGIKAQVFSATGVKIGSEFLVNTATAGSQDQAVVTALDNGGFVVVWRDQSQQGDSSASGIKAQIYNSSGLATGSELLINSTTFNSQDQPAVTATRDGGFAVSWRDNSNLSADASGFGIKTQIFDGQGTKLGSEFQINGITTGNQEMPNIIALDSGALVVSWTDYSGQGGDTDGAIKARILTPTSIPITQANVSNTVVSETAVNNITVASILANGATNAAYFYQIIDDSTGGAFTIIGDKLVVRDSLLLDYETLASASLTVRATDTFGNSFDQTVTISLTDAVNEKRFAGGTEFVADTTITGNQQQGAITALSDGRFVMVWTDGSAKGADTSGSGIKGQIVTIDGLKIGGEFLINTEKLNGQDSAAISALPSGGFVVTWVDASLQGGDTSVSSIKAQIYDATGNAVGNEFLVNQSTANAQRAPAIATLASGGFIITWSDASLQGGDASSTSVKAQLFDAAGNRVGSEFLVNTVTANTQDTPVVASLTGGGFVVSWHDTSLLGGDTSKDSVKAQVFAADGTKVGSEFLVNTETVSNQQQQTIVGLANGGFAIAWADASGRGGDNDYYGIKLQLFDATGAKVGGELLANTTTAGGQIAPAITTLADGNLVVSWADYSGAASEAGTSGIKAQIFDTNGQRVGGEFVVNTQSLGAQVDPAIVAGQGGGFSVVWTDYSGQGGDNLGTSIKYKMFDPLGSQGAPPTLVANADTAQGTEDQSTVIQASSLLVNDVDTNSLPFVLTGVSAVSGGTVALDPDGNVVFTPFANFSGNALFTYFITDSAGVSATGRVTVNVAGSNDAPTANADTVTVSEDGSTFRISTILANDVDVDPGDVLTLQPLAAFTNNGIALSSANGFITYAPGAAYQSLAAGQTVIDSFQYTISDASGALSTAAVTLVVTGVNDAPTSLVFAGGTIDENVGVGTPVGTLSAADIDNGDVLTYSLTSNPGGRFVIDAATGAISVAAGAVLDFETTPSLQLVGRATDSGGLFIDTAITVTLNNLPEPKTYTGDNGVNVFTAPTNDLWAINGLGGNDVLTGNASADSIYGGTGSDILDGAGGADMLYGGTGNDTFIIDNLGDRVVEAFGEGTDIAFTSVDFTMSVNLENLTQAGTANISVVGNDFANTINGNAGDNTFRGGLGGDLVIGAAGNDAIFGEGGNDFLQGGDGNDVLIGGAGLDELTGGAGADKFVFDTLTVSADRDTVKDFSPAEDLFVFSQSTFTALSGLPLGALAASQFVAGAAAQTADQHVIYNKTTGALFYDPDGSGAAAMVQIAFLSTKPTLSALHFLIDI